MTWTKELQNVYNKEYRKKYRDELNAKKKIYIQNNKEKYNEYMKISRKKWNTNNREKIAKYHRERKQNDIMYRIKCYLRTRTCQAVKGTLKGGSAITDMGCSWIELRNHLTFLFKDGMTWNNYGEWEIDHIMPLSKFDLTNKEEFLKAAHYTNLQPMWWRENRIKRDKEPKVKK